MRAGRAVIGGLVVLGLVGCVLLLSFFGGGSSGTDGQAASGCQVDVDTAGQVTDLTDHAQQENARIIIRTGLKLRVPSRGLTVAIATAMQESTLQNLSGGDRDSVGLFQQRNAWGSFAERTTPATAAEMFFTGGRGGQRGLLDIKGWESMSIAEAAQAVQVSAFPTAYAKWAGLAVNVVRQVTGGQADAAPVCANPGLSTPGPGSDLSKYENGRIPLSALRALRFAPGHYLRSDAAEAAEQMAAAYDAHFGKKLCVTDSYRDYDTQVRLKREKGNMAATPGTSNHGWGQAMDMCGGIQNYGTPEYEWVLHEALAFGWKCPGWARQGGSGPHEPWHIQYGVDE